MKIKRNHLGLCQRCEHRAIAIETDCEFAPRAECGMLSLYSSSCYMYKPTAPIIFKRQKNDRRPLTLNIFSCRITPIDVPNGHYELLKVKKGFVAVWVPEGFRLKKQKTQLKRK